MLKKLMGTGDDLGAFVARLALGIVMFPHGAQKVLGWYGGMGLSATFNAFRGMGMPAPLIVLIFAAEILGSLGLVLGLLGRVAAFGITALMLGAIAMVHGKFGFFMNWMGNQKGEGFEYHILALGLALAILIKGSGRWSLDRMLTREQ